MNSILKAVITAAVTVMSYTDYAQSISHSPITDETIARSKLFTLPPGDTNYYFRADLPGDNFLIIEFNKLSYWPGPGVLSDIIGTAKQTVSRLQDSFTNGESSRKIAIHIPANNAQVIASISEYQKNEKLVVIKNGGAQPMRIGMDTVSVLKTFDQAKKDTSNVRQIRYSFIIKDLEELNTIAENTDLIADIDLSFDSLVTSTRKRWSRQDAWYHTMDAEYDPAKRKIRTDRIGTFFRGLSYNAELGASFIYNTIAPYGGYGLTYRWPNENHGYNFVRIGWSGISFFNNVNNKTEVKNVSFINAEFGALNDGLVSFMPHYKTSIGFGYKIASEQPAIYDVRYRLFFNYSLSRALTLTPDFYIIPKKGDEKAKTLAGITISLRLFELVY